MVFRNTNQKTLLYNLICENGHMTIDDIKNKLEKENISRATIYRNLNVLILDNKIRLVKINDVDVYERIKEDHFHMVCKICHKIYDIDKSLVNLNVDKSLQDYKLNDIVFEGVCKNCQKEK